MQLPLKPLPAMVTNPKSLIIFSKPKIGKTEAIIQLPNTLIIDCEEGTDYVSGLKHKVKNVNDIFILGKMIKEANYPYDRICLDTLTALETMCIDYSEYLYSKKTTGKNWFLKEDNGKLSKRSGKAKYGTILNMPNGAGL